jgi:hypothetical protein
MTEREYRNYTRGIAYHAIKFERNKIDNKQFLIAMRSLLGEEAIKEAEALVEEEEQNQ